MDRRAPAFHRAASEFVGTALLLAAVVGSGIMADRLAGGSVGLALLANSVATGGALLALILAFGSISGAHLNPLVTLADASQGGLPWQEVPGLRRRPGFRRVRRRCSCAWDVFPSCLLTVNALAGRRRPGAQRSSRNVWPRRRHFGLCEGQAIRRRVCRRRLHHWRLLVHVFDFVCESGSDASARDQQYLHGHPPRRRPWLHSRPARRSWVGYCLLPLAQTARSPRASPAPCHF